MLVMGGVGLQEDALLLSVNGKPELFHGNVGDARLRAIHKLKLP
jgi:hypothetical protein